MADVPEPYQHHIARLLAENQELREVLRQQKLASEERARVLRAQLNEGLSPQVRILKEENRRLKNENSRIRKDTRDALRNGKGLPPVSPRIAVPESMQRLGSRTSGTASTEAAERTRIQVKKKLRSISVVISQTKELISWLVQHPTEFSPNVTAELAELLEMRREELRELEAMMHSVPASAAHRGTKSYRPVPSDRGTL